MADTQIAVTPHEKAARRAAAEAFGEEGLQAALDAYRAALAAPYVPPPLPPEPPDGTVLAWEVPAGYDDDGEPTNGSVRVARRADQCATGSWGGDCDQAKTVSRWLANFGDGIMSWEKLVANGAGMARRMVELPSPDDEAAVGHLAAIFSEVVKGHHATDVNLMSSTFTPWSDFARAALSALADQRGQQ